MELHLLVLLYTLVSFILPETNAFMHTLIIINKIIRILLLFSTGTLIQRMLGQKKTKDDRLNTVTAPEFFTHYPTLQHFLLQQMISAVKQHQGAALKLHPSLFPVLAILAKLSAGVETATSDRSVLVYSYNCHCHTTILKIYFINDTDYWVHTKNIQG